MAPAHTTTVLDRDENGPGNGAVGEERDLKKVLLPLLLVIVGLLVLLYPVVATQWNNLKQMRAAEAYAQFEEEAGPDALAEMLESAHRYNETRTQGPIFDPWLSRVGEDNSAYQAYLQELSLNETMGRIVVPAAQADLPIYHGTTDEVLQKGVGHLFGSDLPVGGENTHSVLTGHTGLANATLFDNLKDVVEGDAIYVAVSGERLKYEVGEIRVVEPNDTEGLGVQQNEDLLTLITCTPYGINSHRLIVTGHRVPMDPADEEVFEESGLTWQWWMWAILALAAAIVAGLIWWAIRMRRALAANDTETDADAESDAGDDVPDAGNGADDDPEDLR
ncbi:class C sortase [uncultured Corynebacterium sp.]|uniref:class C sortase n=1 Tax=uncultured Corynebacterium sp. TaxID=159447 RepID=UPI0025F1ACCA|nr:class C sortase [uncultured Corynebacterium sp.]